MAYIASYSLRVSMILHISTMDLIRLCSHIVNIINTFLYAFLTSSLVADLDNPSNS